MQHYRDNAIKIETIVLITSDGDYTLILTNDSKKGLVTKTMKEWKERLPEKYFFRVHRNSIINTEYIDGVEK